MAKRKPREDGTSRRGSGRRRRIVWALARWGVVGAVWSVFVLLSLVAWLAYDLPDVGKLDEIQRRPSVTLLAADGSTIGTFGDLYGETVQLKVLPPYLPKALIATEDRRFYYHFGIDPIGIARALYVNFRRGEVAQGGSTITQQLAKNVFLTPDRTVRRKGQELLLALWLERNFTKDQILTLYLNRVYLGSGTYGVDAAARKYFGKPAARLTLYESAMLIGLLKAPSRFSPLADSRLADERARLVLANMVDAGELDEAEARRASENRSGGAQARIIQPLGQYFADWVLDQVSGYVGYSDRDLVVATTLDPRLQRLAEAKVDAVLAADGAKYKASQAAFVVMEPDGKVRAMVGGRDYGASQFNRATQAMRQPGSAFKLFVYLAGLEAGLQPDTHLFDGPISIGGYRPDNYDGKYYGDVSLREAFARSLNSVAVQISERVGRKRVAKTAHRLGITSDLAVAPSIALGTSEVTLLELTAAYGVFANEGLGVWPSGIEEIRDKQGEVLYRRAGSGPGRVVARSQLAGMVDLMSAVVQWGTGKAASPGRPAAGKTGTSTDFRDAWFVGFTAELIAGVWVGNDDAAPMAKTTGGTLPARIWHDFMTEALDGQPQRPLLGKSPQIASAAPPPEEESSGLFDSLIKSIIEGGGKTVPRKPGATFGQSSPPGDHK